MKRPLQESGPMKRRVFRDVSNISPPVTPDKQRIVDLLDGSEEPARKKLFPATPPTTPQKPKFSGIYSKAKGLFLRGHNEARCLVGREEEAKQLNHFLIDRISKNESGSLYVSGPPGTGKSAQLNLSVKILQEPDTNKICINNHTCTIINLNCMSLTNPEAIFNYICEQITQKRSKRLQTCDDLFQLLQRGTTGSKVNSVLLVLDELDFLMTRNQELLFQLFNLSAESNSSIMALKFILVGISNSLDLTDKILPRLKRNNLNPSTSQFKPYSFEQLRRIITSKLNSLVEEDKENHPSTPIVDAGAIILCCKKVASISGDLRKAFDMIVKSIELLEKELAEQHTSQADFSFMGAPKVKIQHIARVCGDAMATNYAKVLRSINLMQKVVLAYLFNYQIEEASVPNINAFFDYYFHNSSDNKLLTVLKKTEFLEVVSALESLSLVTLSTSGEASSKLVKANVGHDEFVRSIQDIGILKKITK